MKKQIIQTLLKNVFEKIEQMGYVIEIDITKLKGNSKHNILCIEAKDLIITNPFNMKYLKNNQKYERK